MILTLIFSFNLAHAEMVNVAAIMKKGIQIEKTEPAKLLKQISLKPTKDSTAENPRFEVMKVEKGSIYDREGIKVGDIVTGAP